MLTRILTTAAALLLAAPLFAQTADDCVAEFEDLRAQFEAADPDAEIHCARAGSIISLDVEGNLPEGCDGSWDHWHLEAKATGQKEGACIMMLRGLEGQEGCGTEEFKLDLPANEAAQWRNYLNKVCPN